MSELSTINDIKIPYPSEGVIRTAQLDDTVSPADSVELAINMNFDRIGATQTRLGVQEYAPTLSEPIKNYGTLLNSYVPDGYTDLVKIGLKEQWGTDVEDLAILKLDATHILVQWRETSTSIGFLQAMEINIVTGGCSPLGTPFQFSSTDTGNAGHALQLIFFGSPVARALATWSDSGNDGFAQTFDINIYDWSITDNGSPFEFDSANGEFMTMTRVDGTTSGHWIVFYNTSANDGAAVILEVDIGGNVTKPGSATVFETVNNEGNSCQSLGDGIHFINAWFGGAGNYAQAFSVNTGTWAITAIGTKVTISTAGLDNSLVAVGDGQKFIDFFQGTTGAGTAQALSVNLSTFAVTLIGTPLSYGTVASNNAAVSLGDGQHFVNYWQDTNARGGRGQIFNFVTGTNTLTVVGDQIELGRIDDVAAVDIDGFHVEAIWSSSESDPTVGYGAMFATQGAVTGGRWLYAAHGDEVSNLSAGVWTSRRSGLAEVSKPRFSVFLSYIWMVNGNPYLGGDPIATSRGGNFGTEMVPDDFPGGDFIHAGFEGRVWVFNKTLGTIYFTDIVQFALPNQYYLTYNPDVNVITQIAPQTGESFTAVYRVPRALLVFTQNNIYRIYGATSIDAYPAYNVGTFSQESIIETKTGIFFHHSSGFYQFDYGGQPVEISRRIIDFVRAIPRSYYENITGVYDGFDAVEWMVGPVVVDGVSFANCVVRFTISTQVWTIYDYVGNVITAMIYYDDGTNLNHLMGTFTGKTGAMDTGYDDFGQPFYYEVIDRWRSFTDMYYKQKSISGLNVYSENAAGSNLTYQVQKSGPNVWLPLDTITEENNSLSPNTSTEDFDVIRLRIAGTTRGTPVVIHGIEITSLTIKGQDQN